MRSIRRLDETSLYVSFRRLGTFIVDLPRGLATRPFGPAIEALKSAVESSLAGDSIRVEVPGNPG